MDEKKLNDLQRLLFEQLKNQEIGNVLLVDVLSDLLNISNDAVYRRMRGEKRLDIDELTKICTHFNISFDTLLGTKESGLQFNYIPLDLSNKDVYKLYMKQLLLSFSALSNASEKEMFFTAIDIPMFHFLPHTELTLFKVFSWSNSTGAFQGSYSNFCNQIKDVELLEIYNQLVTAYNEIPSVEIWTEGTFDAILRLIDYYFESGYFSSKDEALLLCSQLLEMVTRINQWSTRGFKDELQRTAPFKLYLSGIELENNFVVIKRDQTTNCIIKLYTINSMTTNDLDFCNESMKWIDNAMQKSTLISGSSQKESFKFFNLLNKKVRYLIERIERSNTLYSPY
jgi:transcriptional regulator with XRE-family HTH domain